MKEFDIIKRPIITEQSNKALEANKYTFAVDKKANKIEIKNAIEKIFGVNVVEIRTINVHQKAKRMQRFEGFKSAYKTEDKSIPLNNERYLLMISLYSLSKTFSSSESESEFISSFSS